MLANIQRLTAGVVKNNFLVIEAHVGRRHEALGKRRGRIGTFEEELGGASEEIISIASGVGG